MHGRVAQITRRLVATGYVALAACLAGCQSVPAQVDNPVSVGEANYDRVWSATIDVVEKYFDIAYENRYDGRIETLPQSAATLLEPWRPDSVGFDQRLLASMQTIRRRCFVLVQSGPTGGYNVTVEVYKELEDLSRPAFANFAGASFIRSIEPTQERVVTSPVAPAAGWISLGRDTCLETVILHEIQKQADCYCTP